MTTTKDVMWSNHSKAVNKLMQAAIDVLESHDQTGCDGFLTVCTAAEMRNLQVAVENLTGKVIGTPVETPPHEEEE